VGDSTAFEIAAIADCEDVFGVFINGQTEALVMFYEISGGCELFRHFRLRVDIFSEPPRRL